MSENETIVNESGQSSEKLSDPILQGAVEAAMKMGVTKEEAERRAGLTAEAKPEEEKTDEEKEEKEKKKESRKDKLKRKEEKYNAKMMAASSKAMMDSMAAANEKAKYETLMSKLRERPTEFFKETGVDIGKVTEDLALEGTPEFKTRKELEALKEELARVKHEQTTAAGSKVAQDFVQRARTVPDSPTKESLETNMFVSMAFDKLPDDVLIQEGYLEAQLMGARTGRNPGSISNQEIVQSLNQKYARLFANFLKKSQLAPETEKSESKPAKSKPSITEAKSEPVGAPENLAKLSYQQRLEYVRKLESAGKL